MYIVYISLYHDHSCGICNKLLSKICAVQRRLVYVKSSVSEGIKRVRFSHLNIRRRDAAVSGADTGRPLNPLQWKAYTDSHRQAKEFGRRQGRIRCCAVSQSYLIL